jgi:hypothetical protein
VQVDPITPTLKAPATKRLKLRYDGLLSNFAFNFNLRRYITEQVEHQEATVSTTKANAGAGGAAGGSMADDLMSHIYHMVGRRRSPG